MNNLIFAIGGALKLGADNPIVTAFMAAAGGASARIVVIPAAKSGNDVLKAREDYVSFFEGFGARVDFLMPMNDQLPTESSNLINQATAIFFSGGSQTQLMELLDQSGLVEVIKSKFATASLTIAGTSAGCAIQSEVMIVRGDAQPQIGSGLGLITDYILDQHFSSGNQEKRVPRFARLLQATYRFPQLIGIGIDENTAAVFSRGKLISVLGEGTVTMVDASQATKMVEATRSDDIELQRSGVAVTILRAVSPVR